MLLFYAIKKLEAHIFFKRLNKTPYFHGALNFLHDTLS